MVSHLYSYLINISPPLGEWSTRARTMSVVPCHFLSSSLPFSLTCTFDDLMIELYNYNPAPHRWLALPLFSAFSVSSIALKTIWHKIISYLGHYLSSCSLTKICARESRGFCLRSSFCQLALNQSLARTRSSVNTYLTNSTPSVFIHLARKRTLKVSNFISVPFLTLNHSSSIDQKTFQSHAKQIM